MQPQQLEDYGGSLTPVVKERMPECLRLALQQLAEWGVRPSPRNRPLTADEHLNAHALGLDAYEAGRPGADEACRIGDARFLFG